MGVFSRMFSTDAPPRKRVLRFVWRYACALWELVKLNVLFLLCCLPVVTAGAACAGLTAAASRLAAGTERGVWRDFRQGAARHWRAFSVYLPAEAALFAVLLYAAHRYGRPGAGALAPAACALCVGAALFAYLTACYLHAVTVRTGRPARVCLRNAALLVLTGLPDLGYLGGALAAVMLCAGMMPYSLPLVLLLLPATCAFLVCFGAQRGLQAYLKVEE